MEEVQFADSLKNRLFLNLWISLIRFIYVSISFALVFWGGLGTGSSVGLVSPLTIGVLFATVLGIFATFALYSFGSKTQNLNFVDTLSTFQVILDLLIIFVLYKNIANLPGSLQILYFVPTLYSIILFRSWVPFALGAASVLLISNFFIAGIPNDFWVYTAIYLVGGWIISIISSLVDSQRRTSFLQSKELVVASKVVNEMKRITKAQEIEISQVEDRLNSLDRSKSDFVTLMTHELRTPLSAINWSLDIIASENDLNMIKATAEKASLSVRRMNGLIDRIIGIGKESDVSSEYVFSKVNINDLIIEVKNELSASALEKGVRMFLNLDSASTVEVDRVRMKIVFDELLQNAITYTPKGGEVSVSINTDKLNTARNSIDIIFSDTGMGISESEKDKIFERFYRGANAIKVETDGTGLGLYVVREIVAKHRGSIWFENRSGRGTSFHVELPVSQTK